MRAGIGEESTGKLMSMKCALIMLALLRFAPGVGISPTTSRHRAKKRIESLHAAERALAEPLLLTMLASLVDGLRAAWEVKLEQFRAEAEQRAAEQLNALEPIYAQSARLIPPPFTAQ